MALYTFDEQSYVVIHSDDGYLQFSEMGAGTELVTPYDVEVFTDEAEAKARAEELGYVFIDPSAPPEPPLPPLPEPPLPELP
jgi:hypothetical protein